MSIPVNQQDYDKYMTMFKGNYYKGASTFRSMMNTASIASEIVQSPAAMYAVMTDFSRSSIDKMCYDILMSSDHAEEAIVTFFNAALNREYTTLDQYVSNSTDIIAIFSHSHTLSVAQSNDLVLNKLNSISDSLMCSTISTQCGLSGFSTMAAICADTTAVNTVLSNSIGILLMFGCQASRTAFLANSTAMSTVYSIRDSVVANAISRYCGLSNMHSCGDIASNSIAMASVAINNGSLLLMAITKVGNSGFYTSTIAMKALITSKTALVYMFTYANARNVLYTSSAAWNVIPTTSDYIFTNALAQLANIGTYDIFDDIVQTQSALTGIGNNLPANALLGFINLTMSKQLLNSSYLSNWKSGSQVSNYRTELVAKCGNLITTDDILIIGDSYPAMLGVATNSSYMTSIAKSEAYMNKLPVSIAFTTAVVETSTALNIICAYEMAVTKFALGAAGLSPTKYEALATLTASSTAMVAIADSSQSMTALANSSAAMNLIRESSDNMLLMVNSTIAMNAIVSNSIATTSLRGKYNDNYGFCKTATTSSHSSSYLYGQSLIDYWASTTTGVDKGYYVLATADYSGNEPWGSPNDNYYAHVTTYVYLKTGATYTKTLVWDDGDAFVVNNSLIHGKGSNSSASISFTLNAGWNKLEFMWDEGSGGAGCHFNVLPSTFLSNYLILPSLTDFSWAS